MWSYIINSVSQQAGVFVNLSHFHPILILGALGQKPTQSEELRNIKAGVFVNVKHFHSILYMEC